MKLRKDQRFTAYCFLLQEAESYGKEFCFCPIIEKLTGIWFCTLEYMKRMLPELYNKRPDLVTNTSIWFNNTTEGWLKRIELLKQCIEETSDF